jgi:hypothetical protein
MHIRRISVGVTPFGIDYGFVRRDIEMQVLLRHSTAGM